MNSVIRLFLCFCIIFTSQTLAFADKMKILTVIEPPTNYLDKNKKLTGLTTDYVREIQRRLGNKDAIRVTPPKRALMLLELEPNIVMFTVGRSKVREPLYHWIAQVTVRFYSFFALKTSKIKIDKLEDAKKIRKIGVLRGGIREKILMDNGFTNFKSVSKHEQNLKKLMCGRIDLMFYSALEMASLCKSQGFDYNKIEGVFDVKEAHSYIIMSKNGTSPEIVKKWKDTAQKIKDDGTFNNIMKKWIDLVRNQYGIECKVKDGVFYFSN